MGYYIYVWLSNWAFNFNLEKAEQSSASFLVAEFNLLLLLNLIYWYLLLKESQG